MVATVSLRVRNERNLRNCPRKILRKKQESKFKNMFRLERYNNNPNAVDLNTKCNLNKYLL